MTNALQNLVPAEIQQHNLAFRWKNIDKSPARDYGQSITEEGGGPEQMTNGSRPGEVAGS
jgi:hypothetical protein